MKKVRSSSQMKVKRKNDVSRPSTVSGIGSIPKPVRTVLPPKFGSTLDKFNVEEIKLA